MIGTYTTGGALGVFLAIGVICDVEYGCFSYTLLNICASLMWLRSAYIACCCHDGHIADQQCVQLIVWLLVRGHCAGYGRCALCENPCAHCVS